MKTRFLTFFSAFIFGTALSLVAADNAAPACSVDKSAGNCPACACKKGESCACEKGKCTCGQAADKAGCCEKKDAACCEKKDAACCKKSDKCDKSDAKASCPASAKSCPADKSACCSKTDKDAKAVAGVPAGYPLTTCVVSDEVLGSMGEPYVYTFKQAGKPDRTVVFCCKMCVKSFEKNPAKYLSVLDGAAVKVSTK